MCDLALHNQQCQGDLAEAEASVEAIQGLRQRLLYMWDVPPGSPSTSDVSPARSLN